VLCSRLASFKPSTITANACAFMSSPGTRSTYDGLFQREGFGSAAVIGQMQAGAARVEVQA